MRFIGLLVASAAMFWLATELVDTKPQFFNWVSFGTAIWLMAWALFDAVTMGVETFGGDDD